MSNPSEPAARVYAAALVEVGNETGTLGRIHDDLIAVARLYDEDPWFRNFFTSPRIDREVKWQAIRSAFEGQVGRPILGLLRVMIVKGRTLLLDNVADQFVKFRDMAEHRIHAHVTVAAPLSDADREALHGRLGAASGKNVELHVHVDAAVLGGAAIRVGDRVIDRTLRTRLAALRDRLVASAESR